MRRTTRLFQKPCTDRGSMSVELVLLTPVMVAFMLLIVAMGRYVVVRGDVEAASRDAVRAASLERTGGNGVDAARMTAEASLNNRWNCTAAQLGGDFQSGATIQIQLTCKVPWSGLGLIGLSGTKTVRATSSAPIDLYRRTG